MEYTHYKIVVFGKPIAKKRPRFFRKGNFVGTYNAQETEEGRWLLEAKKQIKQKYFGPVSLSIIYYFARPKSHFGTGKNSEKKKPSAPRFHTQRPDKDNLDKFVWDCLNNEAYNDDAQIVYSESWKRWTIGEPRTEIIIKGLNYGDTTTEGSGE